MICLVRRPCYWCHKIGVHIKNVKLPRLPPFEKTGVTNIIIGKYSYFTQSQIYWGVVIFRDPVYHFNKKYLPSQSFQIFYYLKYDVLQHRCMLIWIQL